MERLTHVGRTEHAVVRNVRNGHHYAELSETRVEVSVSVNREGLRVI